MNIKVLSLALLTAAIAALATVSFAAAPGGPGQGGPGGAGPATGPGAGRGFGGGGFGGGGGGFGGGGFGGGRGGGFGGGARGPTVAPPPSTDVADNGMPIPDGVLPIKGAGRGPLAYVPRVATQPAIVGPNGRGPTDAQWIVSIQSDPGDLKVYAKANAELGAAKPGENRVVFLGDSITEKWQKDFGTLFPGKSDYIGRGSTSESTQQMLVRFRPDVIKLGAKVVVLQAGMGDVAGMSGDVPDGTIHDNFAAILDIAKVNNVKVVWVSTLPADHFFWRTTLEPAKRIADLVAWEKEYAGKNGAMFVDAYTPLKDDKGGLAAKYTTDGAHPNADGFKLISSLVEPEIEKALK